MFRVLSQTKYVTAIELLYQVLSQHTSNWVASMFDGYCPLSEIDYVAGCVFMPLYTFVYSYMLLPNLQQSPEFLACCLATVFFRTK